MKSDFSVRARALVGTRFRPQGRDPAQGLDCVGLVLCAFNLPTGEVREDYRLRGDHRRELIDELSKSFRRIGQQQKRAGDVLLMMVDRQQLHLGILTDRGFVHADARLGKVVETLGPPAWPIAAVFRRRVRAQGHG